VRFLVLLLAAVVLLWVLLAASAHLAANEALDETWPGGLGTIRDVPGRHPLHPTTPAAQRLAELASAADVQLGMKGEEVGVNPLDPALDKAFVDFVYAQLEKPDDWIDYPPLAVTTFLKERQSALASVTQFLIASAPAIDWRDDLEGSIRAYPPVPGCLSLARFLGADALVKARAGDASAWDDVHAIDLLGLRLLNREDTYSGAGALSIVRLANGLARKLPPPVPAWWHEVEDIDARRVVVGAYQGNTWVWWNWLNRSRKKMFITALIFSPYVDISLAGYLKGRRRAAEEFLAAHECAIDPAEVNERYKLPSWNFFALKRYAAPGPGVDFQRAGVFDFERSATMRVMAIKGSRAFPASSRCSDGTWSYANNMLQFSKPIPIAPPGRVAVPVTLRY